MPPGRGRGRGRGRGKSTSEPVAPESISVTPGATHTEPSVSTPQHLQDSDPSPNSSPVTIPTETPAPTPLRAATQRPDGPSSSVASGAGRGKIGTRETAAPSKFKPKITRRAQDEREELARAEMKRKENVAREAARVEAINSRGRGRGFAARGRGDAMGRREEKRTTASGIFGIAPEEMAKQTIQSTSTRGFGNFDADDYHTLEQGGRGLGRGSVPGKGQSQEVIYPPHPEERHTGRAIDIERIGAASDDEDDDDVIITGSRVVNKGKSSQKGGLKPVRLPRHEHKARTAILNDSSTDSPALKKEESDDDMTMTGVFPRNTAPGDEFVVIKMEPGIEVTYRDSVAAESPPNSTKQAEIQGSSSSAIEIDPPSTPPRVKVKNPTSPQLSKKTLKKPPVFTCEEDKAEYARHLEDVAILAAELGGMQSRNRDNDGDVDMDGVPHSADAREGRLYLFQFPPVLPKLYNPLTSEKPPFPGSIKIKKEDKGTEGKDSEMGGTGKTKGKPVDLATSVEIKPEAEEIVQPTQEADKNKRVKRDRVVDEQGYVGKMIVRESGKVELSWGGTSLVVGRGVDAGFLTTGVVVDANMRGARPGLQPHEIEGKAIGMGKIMGKFVVTPDFAKMFGDEFL